MTERLGTKLWVMALCEAFSKHWAFSCDYPALSAEFATKSRKVGWFGGSVGKESDAKPVRCEF